MRVTYSFIIDGGQQFERQARVFLRSLTAVGVSPSQIICHRTDEATAAAVAVVDAYGVETVRLIPFLDRQFCNKLVQLETLLSGSSDYYVLCDTDLAFTTPFDPVLGSDRVRAKLVNGPNPPLETLESIRRALGIRAEPRLVQILGKPSFSYSVNCNGGIYIIPAAAAAALAQAWPRTAERMLAEHRDLYPGLHYLTDQISFAMTMLSLGLDVDGLPLEWNFAVHRSDLAVHLAAPPSVLHYHKLQDESGQLLHTGIPIVDSAIGTVNALATRPPPLEFPVR